MNNFIKMYWATVFYFKKTAWTEKYFTLLKHIKQNYQYYRFAYSINETKYRNDYAFTIAMHMMNNHSEPQMIVHCQLNYFTLLTKIKF